MDTNIKEVRASLESANAALRDRREDLERALAEDKRFAERKAELEAEVSAVDAVWEAQQPILEEAKLRQALGDPAPELDEVQHLKAERERLYEQLETLRRADGRTARAVKAARDAVGRAELEALRAEGRLVRAQLDESLRSAGIPDLVERALDVVERWRQAAEAHASGEGERQKLIGESPVHGFRRSSAGAHVLIPKEGA